MKDTNGLRFLAHLLRHPHQPVAALEIDRTSARRDSNADAAGVDGADRATRERARVNVTRALRGALERIAAHHPELARHLAATLRTGTFCVYTPDPRVPDAWEQ